MPTAVGSGTGVHKSRRNCRWEGGRDTRYSYVILYYRGATHRHTYFIILCTRAYMTYDYYYSSVGSGIRRPDCHRRRRRYIIRYGGRRPTISHSISGPPHVTASIGPVHTSVTPDGVRKIIFFELRNDHDDGNNNIISRAQNCPLFSVVRIL